MGVPQKSIQDEIYDRRKEVARLHTVQGLPFSEVAEKIRNDSRFNKRCPKYSQSLASQDFKAFRKDVEPPDLEVVEHYRFVCAERLEFIWRKQLTMVKAGDSFATDKALKVINQLADLFGVKAPVQIQVESKVSTELERFMQLVEQAVPQEYAIKIYELAAQFSDNPALALGATPGRGGWDDGGVPDPDLVEALTVEGVAVSNEGESDRDDHEPASSTSDRGKDGGADAEDQEEVNHNEPDPAQDEILEDYPALPPTPENEPPLGRDFSAKDSPNAGWAD